MAKKISREQILAEVGSAFDEMARRGIAPEQEYELVDLYGLLAQRHRAPAPIRRRRGPALGSPDEGVGIKLSLSKPGRARARAWLRARLRVHEPLALELRANAGIRAAGLRDAKLAEAYWRHVLDRETRFDRRTGERIERLEKAFRRKKGEELWYRLWERATLIANDFGCTSREAALWCLCGEEPALTALRARAWSRTGAARTIEVTANPDLVTPDELRAAYRWLRRYVLGTANERLREFLSPEGLAAGIKDVDQQLNLWNELYPLDRYSNRESFRVATSRAMSTQHRRMKRGTESV